MLRSIPHLHHTAEFGSHVDQRSENEVAGHDYTYNHSYPNTDQPNDNDDYHEIRMFVAPRSLSTLSHFRQNLG